MRRKHPNTANPALCAATPHNALQYAPQTPHYAPQYALQYTAPCAANASLCTANAALCAATPEHAPQCTAPCAALCSAKSALCAAKSALCAAKSERCNMHGTMRRNAYYVLQMPHYALQRHTIHRNVTPCAVGHDAIALIGHVAIFLFLFFLKLQHGRWGQ